MALIAPLCLSAKAQTTDTANVRTANAPIVRFEHSLLPDTPIAGEPAWSLAVRMKHYGIPGLQVAVLSGGKLAWTKSYGLADPKTHRAVTTKTVFDAGSVSKAVTALAIVKLADEGRFTLDTPINSLLRSWKLPENDFTRKTPVTLRHLLMHTAGVNVGGFWGYLEKDPQPTLLQILDGLPPATNGPIRVENEPGKTWRYSGGGYVVLQQMLEDVTGKPFAEAMDEIVLHPLGMMSSTFVQGLPLALRGDAAIPTSEASYFSGKRLHPHAAAAGLYTTAADLSHYVEAVYRSYKGEKNAFLSREMARQMIEPTVFDREPWDRTFVNRRNTQKDQAVGLMQISRSGAKDDVKYTYFDGLNSGFRSRMIFNAQNGDGAILMLNSDGDEEFLLEATRAVASTYGWNDWVSNPIQPITLSDQALDHYCGRYRRNDDSIVAIRREGKHLLWTDLYTATQPVYPIGGSRFEHRALFGHPSEFKEDTQGCVASLDGWPRLPDNAPTLPSEYLLRGALQKGADTLRCDTTITGQRLFEMGFNLLELHKMPKAAVVVFRVGVEKALGAPGAWDALGDALKRAGKRVQGERAEERARTLRAFQERLGDAFLKSGMEGGKIEYARLRQQFGDLPLGDLLERLSRRLREAGKLEEADTLLTLNSSTLPKRAGY